MSTPTVVIITFCSTPALSYGTLLVFKTLRTGFPTARVVVIDNGSHKKVLPAIERAAVDAGCEFRSIRMRHFVDNLLWLLLEQEEFGPFVLLDPDVILWEKVEHWNFDKYLMAGRLMPWMQSPDNVIIAPRLHPSHLWIPSPDRLRASISNISKRVSGSMLVGNFVKNRFVFDTLSPLYLELRDRCHSFTDDELDHFDHIFNGSHLPQVGFQEENSGVLSAHKKAAAGDISSLRGLWRSLGGTHVRGKISGGNPLDYLSREMVIVRLLEAQGMDLSEENVSGSLTLMLEAAAKNNAKRATTDKTGVELILSAGAAALASHLEQINGGAGA